jgi:hypothetical protein
VAFLPLKNEFLKACTSSDEEARKKFFLSPCHKIFMQLELNEARIKHRRRNFVQSREAIQRQFRDLSVVVVYCKVRSTKLAFKMIYFPLFSLNRFVSTTEKKNFSIREAIKIKSGKNDVYELKSGEGREMSQHVFAHLCLLIEREGFF